MSAYTRQKGKSKYTNRMRLERASPKQSSDTHKTPYDRVKRCRERKINIKASERVNVDAEEYTTCIQVDLKQGFQNCSFDREEPLAVYLCRNCEEHFVRQQTTDTGCDERRNCDRLWIHSRGNLSYCLSFCSTASQVTYEGGDCSHRFSWAVLPRGAHTCRPAGPPRGREAWSSSNAPPSQRRGWISLVVRRERASCRRAVERERAVSRSAVLEGRGPKHGWLAVRGDSRRRQLHFSHTRSLARGRASPSSGALVGSHAVTQTTCSCRSEAASQDGRRPTRMTAGSRHRHRTPPPQLLMTDFSILHNDVFGSLSGKTRVQGLDADMVTRNVLAEKQFNVGTRRFFVVRSQRDRPTSSLVYGPDLPSTAVGEPRQTLQSSLLLCASSLDVGHSAMLAPRTEGGTASGQQPSLALIANVPSTFDCRGVDTPRRRKWVAVTNHTRSPVPACSGCVSQLHVPFARFALPQTPD
ncbi:hypothetical protein PR048_016796 [Dryococelus australis]|uniref:Uncharacterized protein n=1 Tax=Dryococelus australis TaxID=614101 RepID=A0ABQ9H7Q4_9NEOP|nr:hypothetical protein PR048_016796 [Dryococelus australis]